MFDALHAAERELPRLLLSSDGWLSFKLDHHPPFVDRMLRPFGGGKILLHRIYPSADAVFHRHPWPSAMRLLEGVYQLALGCGERVAARVIARAPFEYEMLDADAWHSVRPIAAPVLTLMVTGPRWDRPPRNDDQSPEPLSETEMAAMLARYRRHYPLGTT